MMRHADLLPQLMPFTRVDLGVTETPIEPLPRLGSRLGMRLSVKRDDLLPLAMGGNKVRQLEYFLGSAIDAQANTILVSGAIQSNMVRLTVAAACKLGLKAIVQLEDRVPRNDHAFRHSGNVLLDRLFGAEIHYVPSDWDEARAIANLEEIAARSAREGGRPHVIQTSPDYPPLGSLGYAYAAAEIHKQCEGQLDHIVIASGSGISHAGMLLGTRAIGWDVHIHGICVRRPAAEQKRRLEKRLQDLSELMGIAPPSDQQLLLNDKDFEPGYGLINPSVERALHHAARDEALVLDPTYTGRAMAGLISLIEDGAIRTGERVLFIHTGGQPGLFAYEGDLSEMPKYRQKSI